mgnify:CR=1 FL=1
MVGVDVKEIYKRMPPIIAEKKKSGLIEVKFGKDSYLIHERDWESFIEAFWRNRAREFLETHDIGRQSFEFRKLMKEVHGLEVI